MKMRIYTVSCCISIFLLIAGCAEFNSESGGDATKASSEIVPTAVIDSISPSVTTCHEEVIFTGHGEDDDGTITGYLWISSLDGDLSTLPSFSTASLSEGSHDIFFVAYYNEGATSIPACHRVQVGPERVFTEEDWVRAEPADLEALGLDPDIVSTTTDVNDFGNIAYYMKQDQANGVLICNGYLIDDWNYAGHPDLQKDVQSCSKSIIGLVLGLAIDDGIVPRLDFRVKDSYPGFQSVNGFEDQITFRRLVTHTSGMEPRVNGPASTMNLFIRNLERLLIITTTTFWPFQQR